MKHLLELPVVREELYTGAELICIRPIKHMVIANHSNFTFGKSYIIEKTVYTTVVDIRTFSIHGDNGRVEEITISDINGVDGVAFLSLIHI